MSNKFDEMAKGLAQSVTRRQALKKFGLGLAGMALACFGLAGKAEAQTGCLPLGNICKNDSDCCSGICVESRSIFGHNKRFCASQKL
jgi:hypothetical protein